MHLTIWGYPDLMDLAVAHGWKPQGTTDCLLGTEFTAGKTEPDEIWPFNYIANNWQIVSSDDAQNFAFALEKAFKGKKRILDTRNIGNLSGFSSQVLIKLDDSIKVFPLNIIWKVLENFYLKNIC